MSHTQEPDVPVEPTVEETEVAKPSDAERRAVRYALGTIFIAAGAAHLIHRRLYRSLVPDWLAPVRREIEVTTGVLEVFGGAVLFVPKLRRVARWADLAVLAPALPAAVFELYRPFGRRHQRWPGLHPLGPVGRAPAHVAGAALLWWATDDD
jgi:uncharacterized membrane protein